MYELTNALYYFTDMYVQNIDQFLTSILVTDPHVIHVADAWLNSCKKTAISLIGASIADLHNRDVKMAVTPITTNASICDALQQQSVSLLIDTLDGQNLLVLMIWLAKCTLLMQTNPAGIDLFMKFL